MSPKADDVLTVLNHDRDAEAYRYVYPVVSRRARGVSVGVNLNPNNACNFRCVYCQVPDLTRGKGPSIDVSLLRAELTEMLQRIVHGDFLERRVPEGSRRLNDIALSGNGEPTSSPDFERVLHEVGEVRATLSIGDDVETVLITNGTLCHREDVQRGLRTLAGIAGQVWFKLDSATSDGLRAINSTRLTPGDLRSRLIATARACPTWVQTCVFARNGAPPGEAEQDAYVAFLRGLLDEGVPLRGVLLYGLARPSLQPEAPSLSRADQDWMRSFARDIERTGLIVSVSE